jgi:hypothetical protein
MASALPTANSASIAPTALAPAQLGNFRDGENQDSDASDTDQSDASGRSLSPTRQGLSKTKKKKERRQFGAFADELGDLLGAAFQNKDEQQPTGLAVSTHAGTQLMHTETAMKPIPIALPLPSKGELFVRYLTLHAANRTADGDTDMQVEPTSTGPKMCKCFLPHPNIHAFAALTSHVCKLLIHCSKTSAPKHGKSTGSKASQGTVEDGHHRTAENHR